MAQETAQQREERWRRILQNADTERTEPAEVIAPQAPDPSKEERPWYSVRPLGTAGYGLGQFAIGTGGTLGALGNLAANLPGLDFLENPYGYQGAAEAVDTLGFALRNRVPGLRESETWRALTGEDYGEPGTRAESAAAFATEMLPAAGMAGLVRRATVGGSRLLPSVGRATLEEAGPTAAGVGAQQAFYGTPVQEPATAIAATGFGLRPSLGRITETSAAAATRARLSDMTDDDWRYAQTVAQRANEMGFPITPEEAIKSEGLDRVAAQLANRPEGQELARLRAARRDRLGEVAGGGLDEVSPGLFRQVIQNYLAENLARTNRPATTAYRKAESALADVAARRTRAAQPYYEAARARTPDNDVPVDAVRSLDRQIQEAIAQQPQGSPGERALKALRLRLRQRGTDAQVPEISLEQMMAEDFDLDAAIQAADEAGTRWQTNAGTLDLVYRELRDATEAARRDPRNALDLGTGATSAFITPLRVITESNPNIARGRRMYERMTSEVYMPLLEGPLGILARGNPDQQKRMETILGNVLEGNEFDPNDFVPLVNRMADVEGGREAIEGLLHGYLNVLVDNATRSVGERGPRLNPSAFFSSALQGRARQNLFAILDGLDEADQRAGLPRGNRRLALRNILAVMDRTQARGSPMPMPIEDAELIGEEGRALRRFFAMMRPLMTAGAYVSGEVANARDRIALRNAWGELGRALSMTGPEGVQALRRLSQYGGNDRAIMRTLGELLLVRPTGAVPDQQPPETEDESDGNQ